MKLFEKKTISDLKPKPIYLIASYRFTDGLSTENRTWGWFSSLEDAVLCAKNNSGDLHETIFNYLIIEECNPGVCVPYKIVKTFKWKPNKRYGRWIECKKPDFLNGIINFTIG